MVVRMVSMCPMIVWRFEDDHGVGPFCGHFLGASLKAGQMPSPKEDFKGTKWEGDFIESHPSEWFFGFESERQATYYFPTSDREVMREVGIYLRSFLVPPGAFVIGHHQVAFKRADAIRVS